MIHIFAIVTLITSCLCIQVSDNSILSWTNQRGQTQKLVIYELQYIEEVDLTQVDELPNDYSTQNNCNLIFSNQYSQVYSSKKQSYYTFMYIYQVNDTVINKGQQKIATHSLFDLNGSFTTKISYITASDQNSNLLYLYNQNLLYSIDIAIYRANPTCYLLSKMTYDLCNSQQCQTLSPDNVIYNSLATKIDSFSIQNQNIFLISSQPSNNSLIFVFQSKNDTNFTYKITQSKLNFETNIKVSISVLNSQLSGNLQQQVTSNGSVLSSSASGSSSSVSLQVSFANSQFTQQYGYVKIFIDSINAYQKQHFFNPYSTINISLTMSAQSLMIIQLYDINGSIKSKYKFSIDSVLPLKNITIGQNITSSNTTFGTGGIVGIIVSVVFAVIFLIIVYKCYKKYKWFQHPIDNPQSQNQRRQSARDFKSEGLNSLSTLPSNQILFDGKIINQKLKPQKKSQQNPQQKAVSNSEQGEQVQTI